MATVDEMVIKWSMDSSNFNSGITKINQSMKVVKSEFEATSSKVDAFGNETDKLKAKAEYLTKTLNLQEEKVKKLKEQYEKSKKETGENSKETQNLAIKVNQAVKYYNNLEKQLKDVTNEISKSDNGFKKFTKTLNDNKDKINDYSKKAAKGFVAITGAITTAATVLGNFTNDYNESLNKLTVSTGATKAETEELGEIVKNVYADNFGESFGDVADSVGEVIKVLNLTGEELQDITEYAFGFRDAFGYDISESVRAAKALMDNFGTSAEESFNLMVQGEQKGLDYSDELIDSINEYSAQFQKLGFDAEDMFNIFESGAEAGAWNLDKIGDAVKEFSIRAIDGSNTTIEGFTKLGLNADEMASKFARGGDTAKEAFYQIIEGINGMQDPVEQSIVGVDLFGTMWEDLGPEVVGSLGNIKDGFDKTTESAKKMNEVQYNDLGSGLKGLWREIQTEVLEPLNTKLMPKFDEVYKKVQEHMPGIKDVLSKTFDVISDIIIFLLDNGDWLIPLIGGIAAAIGILNLALWGMNIALFANPIVLIAAGIVAAIGAIIAIGVLVMKNWDEIKAKCGEVWDWIKDKFQAFDDWLGSVFSTDWTKYFGVLGEPLNALFANVKNIWNSIKQVFSGIINFIAGVFTGDWSRAWTGVKDIFGGIMSGLGAVIKAPLNAVIALINMAIGQLNKISFTAPDWVPGVGGKHFGVNLPKINYLYTGGIIDSPTLIGNTVVGDAYKGMGRQAEAVIPLDSMYKNIDAIVDRKLKENQQPISIYITNENNIDGLGIAGAVTNKVVKTITRNMKSKNISKGVV